MPNCWLWLVKTVSGWRLGDRLKGLMVFLVNIGLFSAGMVLTYYGVLLLLAEKETSAAMALGAGLVFLFASTIDRFEVLKGMGLEAKTRQIERTIAEAEVTLKQLRDLATMTGAVAIDVQCQLGQRRELRPSRPVYELIQRVNAHLTELGIDRAPVRAALALGVHTLAQDIAGVLACKLGSVCQRIGNALPGDHDDEERGFRRMQLEQFALSKVVGIMTMEPSAALSYPEQLITELLSDWPDLELREHKELGELKSEMTEFAAQIRSLDRDLTFTDSSKVLGLLKSQSAYVWATHLLR